MFRRQRPGVWPQPAAGTFGIAAATGTVMKASEGLQLESKFTEPQSWLFNSKPQQSNHRNPHPTLQLAHCTLLHTQLQRRQ